MYSSEMKKRKSLGQHFLNNPNIAQQIADALLIRTGETNPDEQKEIVFEIGPGKGSLTRFLITKNNIDLYLIELDERLPIYLQEQFPQIKDKIIQYDVLKYNFYNVTSRPFNIIGNFPYNISSQILFKVLENKDSVYQLVGMFQKEVAERVCAVPGKKAYGILSVLIQCYYQTEYLFSVSPDNFEPPPKVQSGVIRLKRKHDNDDKIHYKHLKTIVKAAFNQRRKKLRNALKQFQFYNHESIDELMQKRAEQLSVEEFIFLTNSCLNFDRKI